MTKKKPTKVDLNAMFPYNTYCTRLEIPVENKVCWFKDITDATKYINRYKLDKRKIKLHEKPNLKGKTD